MSRPACAATTAALLSAVAGCAAHGEPMAGIRVVEPATAFDDVPFSLTIRGGTFRPVYRIDTMSGNAGQDVDGFSAFLDPAPTDSSTGLLRVNATAMTWKTETQLVAELPAGIAAGVYDLSVRDPRGAVIGLPRAFTSLGPDEAQPIVVIDSPLAGTLLGAGTDVTVTLHANDGFGTLASLIWSTTGSGAPPLTRATCPLDAGASVQVCSMPFRTGTPASALEALYLHAEALDLAGNLGSADVELRLARRPTVTSIDPRSGPTAGGTLLIVQGSDFIDSSDGTRILVDQRPISTTFAGSGSISGLTLPHDPGEFPLSVRTGGAEADAGTFLFVAPPIVKALSPKQGAAAGGTPVTIVGNNFREGVTTILFDGIPLLCPVFVSENRLEGVTPPGAGTVDVSASDPIGGEGRLVNAFAYDDSLPPGPGCPAAGGGP